jgi:hypothetical protein
MTTHLSMQSNGDAPTVRYHASALDPTFRVQVFLGSAYQALYMDAETARDFAHDILATVPAPLAEELQP